MNALLLPCPGLLARPMAAYGQPRGDQARKTFLLSLPKVSLFPAKACLFLTKVSLFPAKACLSLPKVSLFPAKACLSLTKASLFPRKACLSLPKVSLFPRKACLSLTKESLFPAKACLSLTKVSLFPTRACCWDLSVLPGGGTASQMFKEPPMGQECFHAFPGRSFCLSRRPPGRRLACFPPGV
jgi:hypothetical protein